MRRFLAIFKKELRQIRRDPLSLGVLIFIPALLLVMYGYALSFDVKHIRVAVLDESRTPESRRLLDGLFGNPYFEPAGGLTRRAEAEGLLAHGRARAVLIIPNDYAVRLARGETARIQVLVDGADGNTAATAAGYFEAMADRLTHQTRVEWLQRTGRAMVLPLVTPEPRVWFNPELESAKFLVPGLIGMLMMLSAVIATSLSIVREKERETIEQLMVSPLHPEELVLGKTLPYVLIGLATMVLILVLGWLLFGIVVRGSWLILAAGTLLFLFAGLGLGVMISAVTRTQLMAFQMAIITSLLPSIILSGLIFPIRNMPAPIQWLSWLVVPRHFVEILRGVILKDAPLAMLWPSLAALLMLGLLFNLLAAHKTKKGI
ncbi:MAG: ABC transporter permease [Verrucomicrobia bacterium]|nr:MAG: ABC transporter permease [Verrucomicrobiota bacterium]